MTALAVAVLVAALLLAAAGPARAPGLGGDQRLANSEAQGWGAR